MSNTYIKDDKIAKKLNFFQFLQKVLPYLVEEKSRAFLVLGILICYTSLLRGIPLAIGHIVDLINQKQISEVFFVAMVFLSIRVLSALFSFLLTYKVHQFGNRVLYNIREHVMTHLQALPISYFDKTPVGRTVTRVTNDVLSLGVVLTEGLTGVVLNLFDVTAILLTMFVLSPLLTCILLIFLPIAGWIALSISKKIARYLSRRKEKNG